MHTTLLLDAHDKRNTALRSRRVLDRTLSKLIQCYIPFSPLPPPLHARTRTTLYDTARTHTHAHPCTDHGPRLCPPPGVLLQGRVEHPRRRRRHLRSRRVRIPVRSVFIPYVHAHQCTIQFDARNIRLRLVYCRP